MKHRHFTQAARRLTALTLALLLAGAAFADQEDAPVLLVQLPEDAPQAPPSCAPPGSWLTA